MHARRRGLEGGSPSALRVRVGVSLGPPGSIPRRRRGRCGASGSGRATPILSVDVAAARVARLLRSIAAHGGTSSRLLRAHGEALYTAVDEKPKRTRRLKRPENIEANPQVEVLVDHYEDDWSKLWWVRLRGRARIVEDPEAMALLARKYPQYRERPPVGFVLDGETLYTAVDEKPKRTRRLKRLENIEANPRVEVLVDHYEDDWSKLWWVRLRGRARIVEDPEAMALLARKYPQYREQPPAGPVIAVEIEEWTEWTSSPS